MRATIRVHRFISHLRAAELATSIVRLGEITHCLPMRGGYSLIMLTDGTSIRVAETIDALEEKIDQAEEPIKVI